MEKEKEEKIKFEKWKLDNTKGQELYEKYISDSGSSIRPCPSCKAIIFRTEGGIYLISLYI
jgi:hypothetical protein